MGRGALRVRIRHEGTDVDLVTCHLKSKLLSFPGTGNTKFDTSDEDLRARYGAYALFRRAAEAATVPSYADQLIDGQGEDRCVIVLSDFNDVQSAATTQILLGPPGSQLDTPGAFEHPDSTGVYGAWDRAAGASRCQARLRAARSQARVLPSLRSSRPASARA